ncbi:transposase [Corynebacterium diphtheriae]|uniref:transposase n=1 Tax=Corynebacterium diphtheriae TaxID=1717 RepID=UPI001A7E5369|nr:transposase [Corynebacterium diphtheriae]
MMISHHEVYKCSRWAAAVAISEKIGASPNSIYAWFKKSTLETTESDDFDLAYCKERIERLEAKVKRLEKTISFLRTTIAIFSSDV